MRKVTVFVPAYSGISVDLEVDESLSDDDIRELAYSKARLQDCEAYDFDYSGDVDIEDAEEE